VLGTSSSSGHESSSESGNEYLQWVARNRQEVKDKLNEIMVRNCMPSHKTLLD